MLVTRSPAYRRPLVRRTKKKSVRVPFVRGGQQRGRVPHAESAGQFLGVVRHGAVRLHRGRDGDEAGGAAQRHCRGVEHSRH